MANLIPSIPNPTEKATKTLILAHRTELLEQAQKQIQRYNPNLSVAIEQSRRKVDIKDTDVIVASVQTLGRAGSQRINKLDPSLFKAVIIDEAHHAAASTYTRILDYFGSNDPNSNIFIWGCSATVRRHDGLSLSNVFNNIAYHLDFLEMVERGWLCPLKITTVETKLDISNVGIQNQDFKLSELSEAVNKLERNEIIVKSWIKYTQNIDEEKEEDADYNNFEMEEEKKGPLENSIIQQKSNDDLNDYDNRVDAGIDINDDSDSDDSDSDDSDSDDSDDSDSDDEKEIQAEKPSVKQRNSTLVFAVDIAHTMELCNHFRKYGYHAEYITSNTPAMLRYNIIKRFKNGEFPVLVNCGILTEGTDIPIIDCVLMARPTRSAVLFQQMFGRGMRLSPNKENCLMIDFVDNFKRSGLVTFPTLLGLDPNTIVKGEDALDLEKRAYIKQKAELEMIKNKIQVLDEECPIETQLKITEYDDITEFMTSCSGINKNLSKITSNAWVAVGNDKYALQILGQGLLVLKQQENKKNWDATFQRQLISTSDSINNNNNNSNNNNNVQIIIDKKKNYQKDKLIYTRNIKLPLEADDIDTAIRAADTWIRHSLLANSPHMLQLVNKFAKFRLHPITEKQHDILKKYKIQVKNDINKGQAMDLITRLRLGQAKLWRKQLDLKKKKIEESQKLKNTLRRNSKK
ncbi:unnamed protein product [Cunninghamella blakesleeana]